MGENHHPHHHHYHHLHPQHRQPHPQQHLQQQQQQQQQDQMLLRSINNDHRSFVKFINKTQHSVVLYWIDYQGQAVRYGVLSPDDSLDIDTFVTHPWIFIDEETNDRYTVNQKDVFFPEPCQLPQRCERTHVRITLPMYTLCELALRVIRRRLTYDWQAFLLDIPRSLQDELAMMLLNTQDKGAVAVA